MPAHADFLAAFDAALVGGALPPGVRARDPAEAGRRFAVYQNNVAFGLTEALAARFPVVRRLVGDDFFRAVAGLYAVADRPRSPVLSEWGESFGRFLSQFPPLAGYPYLGDVARIEFARGQAFHAADATPADPAVFAAVDPDRTRLRLHPSVAVLRLTQPAVSIWACNQPGSDPRPIPAGPQIALILRDAAFQVPVRAIGAGDAALIEALLAGATLTSAASDALRVEPGHGAQPILVHLMRAGAVVRPEA
ncbi:DNA-binding domain-containing protein [Rhodobacter sp. Har01]|uniref:HvfC/BufC N-terminal domain-containing protein n=1 Tax=Rhodobacter sp. Har01 TaxID=2883999 RepID=UPI001D078008|nr:DNA-binding domain-containing protein [Rhodobacter sp. Har01]MCB6178921.1 DNA-binding domain-containing protein [Rhodobacter sp. Har01]